MKRRAKIVATLGPASAAEPTLGQLLDAGVDVVRLNLSHGTQDAHRQVIQRVRQLAAARGLFVPILIDLMGPRFRLGTLPAPRTLRSGETVRLGASAAGVDLPVEEPEFLTHLRPGERLLIDNGLIELEILESSPGMVTARVLSGGTAATRKGINLPDTELPFVITEKDQSDIAFAVSEAVDYLAVSFVGGPDDLHGVRAVVAAAGGDIPLIAKLERATVLRRLEATVQAADAVMVARGDLGVEVPLPEVPVLQKRIIAAGRQHGKPVIVATQMLESMMEHPRPTRAEATDVANAVLDGADALMLSGETAAGAYPERAVLTMNEIICVTEAYRPPQLQPPLPDGMGIAVDPLLPKLPTVDVGSDLGFAIPDVVAAAAVYAARRLPVRHIVAFSQSGFTAHMIARYRPQPEILVFTPDPKVAHRVQLVWGSRPLLMDGEVRHHDEVVAVVDQMLRAAELVQPGDCIIILMGDPIGQRSLTNLMRIHRVRPVT